jgi:AbrB family looped-hinge helix DNA binding protein
MPKGKHILSMPHGMHIFGTARVSDKGQLVIPKEARNVFNIKAGDNLLILGDESKGIVITKADVINDVAINILEGMENE